MKAVKNNARGFRPIPLGNVWLWLVFVVLVSFIISSYVQNNNRQSDASDWYHELVPDVLTWESVVNDFSYTDNPAILRSDIDLGALRAMIVDLKATYPNEFGLGGAYLERLSTYEQKMQRVDAALEGVGSHYEKEGVVDIIREVLAFQREVALANPLIKRQPILYVVRDQYARDHHNTETFFHTGEPNNINYRPGGALKLFDPVGDRTAVLLNPGPEGLIRDPEVHFDGDRIVFSMRRGRNKNFSIYEMALDPSNGYNILADGLRRLTAEFDASDIDPLYLPDGKIIFSSTRDIKYCHCNMHIMANLFRMDGDGANIHQISKNTLFDMHAAMLPDGRLLYSRWEYVDRNFGDAQGLWTANPDGTDHAIYWGNNTVSPAAVFDSRAIPGTNLSVCIFGSCHDRPWGALAIIDRNKGIDSEDAVIRIWPEETRRLVSADGSDLPRPFMEDLFRDNMKQRYEDPFPLADPLTNIGGTYFLVSRSLFPYENNLDELQMGIYLVDIFGNEILLHMDDPHCFDPMPLTSHPKPPVIPDRRNFTENSGSMYVIDVYDGTPMQDISRGVVKSLRVIESVEKRYWTIPLSDGVQFITEHNGRTIQSGVTIRPAISWAGFETKRILGTVPVEKDGSAYFELPAEKFVYFQLLDKDGKMIASMRSGTMVQPGEHVGCVGCHDNRLAAPIHKGGVLALKKPASKLNGWYGPERTFCYMTEVQPVWDRHCVGCHDFGREGGETLVLARDKELIFNTSYVELFQNWGFEDAWINTIGLGTAPVIPAYAVGSHQSRLIRVLEEGHHNLLLPQEDMDRIISWIDLGGPYYSEYASANPLGVAGRAPLTAKQVNRLEELTAVKVLGGNQNNTPILRNYPSWISFDRPELSPCLQHLNKENEAYHEALSIIMEGQRNLKYNPDADLPGFTYCEEHLQRKETYERLLQDEQRRRKAIAEGQKVFDKGL